MRRISEAVWGRLPFPDFRPRFFVETFIEKLSVHTPHFFQARLMNLFSSSREALVYLEEYQQSDRKNGGYVLSAVEGIASCWESDPVAQEVFKHLDEPRSQLTKKVLGGDLGSSQLRRLSVFCRAVICREDDYETALISALRLALTGPANLAHKDRITSSIYQLAGLYITHLLNEGYSPTYLINRAEMFTRPNNYGGESFDEQFLFVTERLRSHTTKFDVYYAIESNRPNALIRLENDEKLEFAGTVPDVNATKHPQLGGVECAAKQIAGR